MLDVTYEIVQHDGGWAYKVNGVFSEPLPTHAEALAAAFNCFRVAGDFLLTGGRLRRPLPSQGLATPTSIPTR